MNRLKHIEKCRICGSELTPILDLGNQYLQGSFSHPSKPEPSHRKTPLTLMWCNTSKTENACGAVQLSHTIPPFILYNEYWYVSATTKTMKDHLKSIVDRVIDYFPTSPDINVLDIAANDGTLLSYYPPDKYKRYAVDPSKVIDTITDKSIVVIKDFFPSNRLEGIKFRIITSVAVLYDLDNPVPFIKSIESLLEKDGIWLFEMSYLPTMLEMNAFDTICGEHIFYYSLSVIEYLLDMCGMKLIDATLNTINGGSVQCVAVKKECITYNENTENLNKLRLSEFDMEMDTIKPYSRFADRVKLIISKLQKLIHELKLKNKSIHLLGASTKINTLLQACDFNSDIISYASDRNPNKYDTRTLGTNIKIISEKESRSMKPDVYMVGPWHFKPELLIREKETINNGTDLIFPLPNIEIVTKDGILSPDEYIKRY